MSQQADRPLSPPVTREDVEHRIALIGAWLARRIGAEQQQWLRDQLDRIGGEGNKTALAMAIGLAPRRLGSALLALDASEAEAAGGQVPGLDTRDWTVDQVGRILFLLASFDGDEAAFVQRLETVQRDGELGEQIALLRGLALFPAPVGLMGIAGEGIRSAMQPVFEAVAHRNPYPAAHFSEPMWNQMVVKTLFIDSTLGPIQGLDERRNADLARMLVDYAHERWAASRSVSPELWRCVGPFAANDYFADLLRVFRSGNAIERKAAALAISECPTPQALTALETAPTLWRDIRAGRVGWDDLQ